MTRMKPRPCALCQKRPRVSNLSNPDLCFACYDYAGWENTHSDEGHDDMSTDDPTEASYLENCPICNNVTPPWEIQEEKIMKTTTAKPRTNPTTAHMSHADCKHERTPKGRAACRKALRSGTTLPSIAPTLLYVRVGKSKTVHVPGACTTVKRHDGAIERTDDAVTCKNCMKVTV